MPDLDLDALARENAERRRVKEAACGPRWEARLPFETMPPKGCVVIEGTREVVFGGDRLVSEPEALFVVNARNDPVEDTVDQLIAEVKRLSEWRPIETAPVNESVLIYIPNCEHYGDGIYRGLQVDMGTGRRWSVTGLHQGRDCGSNQPTHWLPLPAAPVDQTKEGR